MRQSMSLAGAFAVVFLLYTGVHAEELKPEPDDVQRIVAVVNDQVISEYDVKERMALIMATTGNVRSQKEYDQLRKTVIQLLVDEKLQLQEAKERKIDITSKEVQERFDELAKRNRVSPQQFDRELARMGASKDTILKQLRASLAWEQVIDQRLRPFLAISDGEVKSYLDRLLASKGQPEYRISEIFLAVDSADQDNEVRQTADRLVQRIRGGADFAAVANQFSDNATGAVGGDKGWIIAEQLEPEIRGIVLKMHEGDVSDPIRIPGGYYIVKLADKRKVMSADPDETQLDLNQIVIRIGKQDPTELEKKINEAAAGISRCTDIGTVANSLGAWDQGSLGKVRLGDLPKELKQAVQHVDVGHASKAIRMKEDFRVLVVCGKKEPEVKEPSFAEIEDYLSNQRLAMMARRYMRDLRRDAIIDYRTGEK